MSSTAFAWRTPPRKTAAVAGRGKSDKPKAAAPQSAAPQSAVPARLMIVDDHPMWRDTLRMLLEHAGVGEVVAEASDGSEALERAREVRPELVVMDVNLPGMDGIEASRALLAAAPDVRILALSSSARRAHVLEAVRAGVIGYMIKTASPDDVVSAVRRVRNGELVFPPELSEVVLNEVRRAAAEGTAQEALRVVVADGIAIDREGLAGLLTSAGFDVVGYAGRADELLARIEADPPDIVVLDVGVASEQSDVDGSVVRRIRDTWPHTGVVVLAKQAESLTALDLVGDLGGVGCLLKHRLGGGEDLGDVIRRIARGESVIDSHVVTDLVARPHRKGPIDDLSARESEVLALMAEGRSNQAIGDRLFLGRKTIEAHVHNIFMKLGLEDAPDDHRRVLAVLTYLRSLR